MSTRKRVIKQAKSNQDLRRNGPANYGGQPGPNGHSRQPSQPNGGPSGYRSDSQNNRNHHNRQPRPPPTNNVVNHAPPPGPPPSHPSARKDPRDPTEEELEVVRAIIKHCDKESFAILTREKADLLPPLVHLSPSTIEDIWRLVDVHANRFLSYDQLAQFVRLLGYAQVRQPIKAELLGRAGPILRIDGWTVPEGTIFDVPANDEERVIVEAIMKEADKGGFGIIERDVAARVLRRSGLPDDDLAIIWGLVDRADRGFLEKGDLKRALRLISCVQQGYPLHARQYEKPWPPPVLDDSFDTTRSPPPPKPKHPQPQPILTFSPPSREASSSSAPPSFPMPNFSGLPTQATGPSFQPPPNFPTAPNFPTNPSMPSISNLPIMPTLTGIAPLNYSFTPLSSSLSTTSRSLALPTRPADDPLPSLTESQREAFITIFNRCNPIGGFITGSQGREVFKRSRLSDSVLDKIWHLSDSSSYYRISPEQSANAGGGSLTRSQFVIGMYFIKAVMDGVIKGENLPDSAPAWLRVEATKDSSKPNPTPFNFPNTPNVNTNANANTQYLPPAGAPPGQSGTPHLRSQSQPSLAVTSSRARPESSLIDMDSEALQPQSATGRRTSANANANPTSGSSSAPASASRSTADLNRDLPPTPTVTSPTSPGAPGSGLGSSRNRNGNANTETASLLDTDLPNPLPEAEAEAPPPYTEMAPNMQIT